MLPEMQVKSKALTRKGVRSHEEGISSEEEGEGQGWKGREEVR